MPRPKAGASIAFVAPGLSAPDAPVCWLPSTGAATLDAIASRPPHGSRADLALSKLACVRHVIIDSGGSERLLLATSEKSITLRLRGRPIIRSPVTVTLQIRGLSQAARQGALLAALPGLLRQAPRVIERTRRQIFLRDALVALDARAAGGSYRDIATVIAGAERARTAWASPSRALKDRMRRVLQSGAALRDGGYRHLIAQGCRFTSSKYGTPQRRLHPASSRKVQ